MGIAHTDSFASCDCRNTVHPEHNRRGPRKLPTNTSKATCTSRWTDFVHLGW